MLNESWISIGFRGAAFAAVLGVTAAGACSDEPEMLVAPLATTAPYKASVRKGTLMVTGSSASSRLALRLQSSTVLALDVNDDGSADLTFDRSTFDRIVVDAGDGDDVVRIDDSNGVFTNEEATTINGGRGADTLLGGYGAETLSGGPGKDLIDGGQGADVIAMGDDDDTFVWDPGDMSDVVDGGAGADLMLFNGSAASETVDVAGNGSHVRFSRDVAGVVTDLVGVERVHFNAGSGTDRVVVNDLAGTGLADVEVNLAGTGGTSPDGQPDVVVVQGTAGADSVDVMANGMAVVAEGLAATVSVTGGEPALDALLVNGQGGDSVSVLGSAGADAIDVSESNGHALVSAQGFGVTVDAVSMSKLVVSGLDGDDNLRLWPAQNALPVELDGGAGNDQLFGGTWAEVLRGGPGDDVIDGGPGADTVFMGDDDDTFVWDPGDASDIVEGEGGADTVLLNGSNASEQIELAANGSRLTLHRDIALVTMDVGGVENVDVDARGGTDRVVVGDLTGTPVTSVRADLAAYPGSGTGDTQADVVVVTGTAGADVVDLAYDGSAVVAQGLAASVSVTGGEIALDTLLVDGAGGDLVNVNGSTAADVMQVYEASGQGLVSVAGFDVVVGAFGMGTLSVNGQGGDDSIRYVSGQNALPLRFDGGAGNDQLLGGYFSEVLLGGIGADLIDGGPGADTVVLGDGDDTFNWDPGDGSDKVDGETGADVMVFNGANVSEDIDLGASGGRLRVLRNIGAVSLDVGGIERVDLGARGGADRVVVGDLTGTGVTQVNLDLAQLPGGTTGDATQDLVTVQGTAAPDLIAIGADYGTAVVSGLPAIVRVAHPDPFDQLTVNGLGGVDTITVDPYVAGLLVLSVNQD